MTWFRILLFSWQFLNVIEQVSCQNKSNHIRPSRDNMTTCVASTNRLAYLLYSTRRIYSWRYELSRPNILEIIMEDFSSYLKLDEYIEWQEQFFLHHQFLILLYSCMRKRKDILSKMLGKHFHRRIDRQCPYLTDNNRFSYKHERIYIYVYLF